MSSQSTTFAAAASTTALLGMAWLLVARRNIPTREEAVVTTADSDSLPSVIGSEDENDSSSSGAAEEDADDNDDDSLAVLPCIRNRRSIFPNGYMKHPPAPVDPAIVRSLLDAALYGPFHGKCYAGSEHPARFVVLGKESMVAMQELTLRYYDAHWEENGSSWATREEYQSFRDTTEGEIYGRWAPASYMIAIVMRRQAGPRRFPEWEEAAAVACAVQNMHIQACDKFGELACYWSSWHDDARDSAEMREFLDMGDEDRCMGFFVVAHAKNPEFVPRRSRDRSLMAVDWRP